MILLLTAGFVIFLDQLTKIAIRGFLSPGQSVDLIGSIRITLVANPGAAFGLLPNHQLVFLVITVVVVTFILFYYRRLKPHEHLVKLALGFELGGAIGNLIDRILFGQVTDFLDFRIWPVFNVADISNVIGLLLFAWTLYRTHNVEGELGTE